MTREEERVWGISHRDGQGGRMYLTSVIQASFHFEREQEKALRYSKAEAEFVSRFAFGTIAPPVIKPMVSDIGYPPMTKYRMVLVVDVQATHEAEARREAIAVLANQKTYWPQGENPRVCSVTVRLNEAGEPADPNVDLDVASVIHATPEELEAEMKALDEQMDAM